MITTCSQCGKLYVERSTDEAHSPTRQCVECYRKRPNMRTRKQWHDRYEELRQAIAHADRAAAENDTSEFLKQIRIAYHAALRIDVELRTPQVSKPSPPQ